MTSSEILTVLRDPQWKDRSNAAVGQHCGCSDDAIWKLRRRHKLTPAAIVRSNGRPMKTGNIGKRCGKALTELQKQRVASLVNWCNGYAQKKANDVLSVDELQSIGYDALMVAAQSWRARRFVGRGGKIREYHWRNYARCGVMQAFRRAFFNARKRLGRTALTGTHPYQQSIVQARLGATLPQALMPRLQGSRGGVRQTWPSSGNSTCRRPGR
jgi:hypothetical protein